MIPTTVIIPAAGSSSRFGNIPKQTYLLSGEPIINYSLRQFQENENVISIIIATQENLRNEIQKLVIENNFSKVKEIVIGGKERQDSVLNAAKIVNNESEIILVHDAARPFINQEMLNSVITKAKTNGSAIVAVKIVDTIKRVDENQKIKETIDRSNIYAAQTPQAFRSDVFQKMITFATSSNFIGTDESMLAEKINSFPEIVLGSTRNIKITTQDDLVISEKLLELSNKKYQYE